MTDTNQLPALPTPKFTETIRGVPCITVTEHEHLMRAYALQARAQTTQAGVPDDVVRDAQRYRWLRKSLPAGQGSLTVLLDDRCNGAFHKAVFMESLDASIDAAMLAASPAQKGGECLPIRGNQVTCSRGTGGCGIQHKGGD